MLVLWTGENLSFWTGRGKRDLIITLYIFLGK